MDLSVSPAIWQQFIGKEVYNISNRERYKTIMDNARIFSTHQTKFENLAKLFKALKKSGLKISPTSDHLTYIILHSC